MVPYPSNFLKKIRVLYFSYFCWFGLFLFVLQIDDEIDGVYRFDKAKYEDELIGWEETAKHLPQYFNKARISAIALLKMVVSLICKL